MQMVAQTALVMKQTVSGREMKCAARMPSAREAASNANGWEEHDGQEDGRLTLPVINERGLLGRLPQSPVTSPSGLPDRVCLSQRYGHDAERVHI